jgi:hypothetical protein
VQIHALFDASVALNGVASLRAEMDPDRASRFPLHMTVAYEPQCKPSTRRIEHQLSLVLGGVEVWPEPDVGIYLPVYDTKGWLRPLREELGEPDTVRYVPHVTLLHHSACRDDRDLGAIRSRFQHIWIPETVRVVSLVAVDDAGVVVDRVSLGSSP